MASWPIAFWMCDTKRRYKSSSVTRSLLMALTIIVISMDVWNSISLAGRRAGYDPSSAKMWQVCVLPPTRR